MKKRDIIIVALCVATALICIALTFWGNYKNSGVLSPDAFYGVLATFIGICATIIVGFQIASFVKIHETEQQIKMVKEERNKMQEEKVALQNEIILVEAELSNAFAVLAGTANNDFAKAIAYMMSISCSNIILVKGSVLLKRYSFLIDCLKQLSKEDKKLAFQHVERLKRVNIPRDLDHYTEIMKIHFEVLGIFAEIEKEETKA